jgi:hypothetical protein
MLTVLPSFHVGTMKGAVLPLVLTGPQLAYLQHIPLSCKVDPLITLDYTFPCNPFMAPLPRSIDSSRIQLWTLWTLAENLFKILLLISVVAVAVKSYTVFSRRRNRMLVQTMCQEKESETSLPIRQKKASSPRQAEDQNERLEALKEELSQPAFKPVHPWIAPPTPLPGPYDAPYYPLPSIRRHSQDDSSTTVPPPQEVEIMHYTRRLPPLPTSPSEPTLQGTIMVSNHGWRRTQWTVSKG